MRGWTVSAALGAAALLLAWWQWPQTEPASWTDAELALLRSLALTSLPELPPDASNAVADDPRAARLGHRLFFDTRLSANGRISCATCHQPDRRFTDGLPQAVAIGRAKRNTPSIVGTAYSPWLYWDGRRDSQWAQALTPLEDPAEHGTTRLAVVRVVARDPAYRRAYEGLFGALPDVADAGRFPRQASPLGAAGAAAAWRDMAAADREAVNRAYANLGKAIAAYERRLMPGPSRFDRYVEAVLEGDAAAARETFRDAEIRGLRLFIGEARCIDCHNGPLLSNNEFHNTGLLSTPGALPDRGRADGVHEVRADPFNCLGPYSDDPDRDCAELEFVRTGPGLLGAMRTPSLRNLGNTAPFMRKGQLASLEDVVAHYNAAPEAMIGHSELEPLGLTAREQRQLAAFLRSLDAPPAAPAEWLAPPAGRQSVAP